MSAVNIRHVVLVLSGKGGVGKSSVAVQLALGFRSRDLSVGLLDIDLCGPSIARMLALEDKEVHQSDHGWVPVYADKEQKLAVMSLAFLLTSREDAVVWRGPKKTAMIKQLLFDVSWPSLDILLIDTPPGTSDEHIAIVENIKSMSSEVGAVLVTTPQNVSIGDVRRQLTFCKRAAVNVHGIIENMSGFSCPHCQECTNIFSSGGGESLAELAAVAFLGSIPLDPSLSERLDAGISLDSKAQEEQGSGTSNTAVQKIISLLHSSLFCV